jgi:hypothetical protein
VPWLVLTFVAGLAGCKDKKADKPTPSAAATSPIDAAPAAPPPVEWQWNAAANTWIPGKEHAVESLQKDTQYTLRSARAVIWVDTKETAARPALAELSGPVTVRLAHLAEAALLQSLVALSKTRKLGLQFSGPHDPPKKTSLRSRDGRMGKEVTRDEHGYLLKAPKKVPVDLAPLTQFSSISVLDLRDASGVTDASLTHAKHLTGLRVLDLSRSKLSDAGLVALAKHKSLQVLSLYRTSLTDAGLARIATLPTLQRLNIGRTKVTDAGLAHLLKLRHLTHLNVGRTGITGAGLAQLSKLGRLRVLDLSNPVGSPKRGIANEHLVHLATLPALRSLVLSYNRRLTTVGFEHLRKLSALTHLDLAGTSVTSNDLAYIGEMTSLRALDLSRSILQEGDAEAITDDGIAHLTKLTGLRTLSLRQTSLSDAGLAQIAKLKQLQTLELSSHGDKGSAITDTGLAHLATMKQLRHLHLGHANVTAKGIKRLQQALPDCVIDRKPRPIGY